MQHQVTRCASSAPQPSTKGSSRPSHSLLDFSSSRSSQSSLPPSLGPHGVGAHGHHSPARARGLSWAGGLREGEGVLLDDRTGRGREAHVPVLEGLAVQEGVRRLCVTGGRGTEIINIVRSSSG
jgi:hypothetical protein